MADAQTTLPDGTVTLLFTDIEGSTKLLHELPDDYGGILDTHHRLLGAVWADAGGAVVDTAGDAFFVSFPGAEQAAAAAARAQRVLADEEPRLKVRMGLHTGTPRRRGNAYWGIDVHYAARVCAAAHGGQVLLSQATRAALPEVVVAELGEFALKDFPAPRALFQLGGTPPAFPPPRTATATNLPTLEPDLVGREPVLAELRERLLGASRLVTLTGLGGSGKTRVALAAATALQGEFGGGAFLVALAPVSDAGGVAQTIADAVRAPARPDGELEAAVIDHLRDRRVLLVADNCEHVLAAAPLLARLLDACPGLRILATSQAPLRIRQETVLPLVPLDVAAAVELFDARARAADPAWALTGANRETVAELCRVLDGLPLAIELAAARVRLAGPAALTDALRRGSDALGRGARDLPARQRGLRAALDHTVALLSPDARTLFAGLAAFAEAWTLEQAEAMFEAELDTWSELESLVDHSLVRTRGDGRLTMPERVRAHARELLTASGREHELRGRHAGLMAAFAAAQYLESALDVAAAGARTKDQLDELEQALRWSADHDPAMYRRLLASSGQPLFFADALHPWTAEIVRVADAEPDADPAADDGLVAGRLCTAREVVTALNFSPDTAGEWMERAVRIHRRVGGDELVHSLFWAAFDHAAYQGEEAARPYLADAVAQLRPGTDPRLRAMVSGLEAVLAHRAGRLEEAQRGFEAIVAQPARTDFIAMATPTELATVTLARGDAAAALPQFQDAIRRLRDTHLYNALRVTAGAVEALAMLGRDEQAAELIGAVRSAYRQLGAASWADEEPEPALQALRARLGDHFDELVARGEGCGPLEAVQRVLAISPAATPGAPAQPTRSDPV